LLEHWFSDHDDIDLVGTGHDRATCLAGLATTSPDVVLLDSMSGFGEALGVEDVRHAAPGAWILVVSAYPPDITRQLIAGQPDGYPQKSSDKLELDNAIRRR